MSLPENRLQEFTLPEDAARFNMIEQQIRPWKMDDAVVLELLATIKRERFVPPAFQALTFMDIGLPLVPEDQILDRPDACMLPPKVEARMLASLAIQPQERALVIGAGSGYFSALVGALARDVLALEIAPDMLALAHDNLKKNGVENVQLIHADGSVEIPPGGFDVIALTGSVAELPPLLLQALNEGGRLMTCFGQEPAMHMQLVSRHKGELEVSSPWDFTLPRLQNFPQPSGFEF